MPNRLNMLLEQQLKADFREIDNFLVIDYTGLDSEKMRQFRDKLRASKLQMEVVKNSIFKIAVKELPAGRIVSDPDGRLSGEDIFAGATGIIIGGESAVDQARFAMTWLKANEKSIKLKGALMGSEVFTKDQIADLSKLASRKELLGMLACVVQTPIQKMAATVQAGYARIVWGMNALAEKLEKAGQAG